MAFLSFSLFSNYLAPMNSLPVLLLIIMNDKFSFHPWPIGELPSGGDGCDQDTDRGSGPDSTFLNGYLTLPNFCMQKYHLSLSQANNGSLPKSEFPRRKKSFIRHCCSVLILLTLSIYRSNRPLFFIFTNGV